MFLARVIAVLGIVIFKITGPFSLDVWFDDGTSRRINFEDVLAGQIYGPLADSAVFGQVRIHSELRTPVWPNGADFDPETLHDWPRHESELKRSADRWRQEASRK